MYVTPGFKSRKIHCLTGQFHGKYFSWTTDIALIAWRFEWYQFIAWNLPWNSPSRQWIFSQKYLNSIISKLPDTSTLHFRMTVALRCNIANYVYFDWRAWGGKCLQACVCVNEQTYMSPQVIRTIPLAPTFARPRSAGNIREIHGNWWRTGQADSNETRVNMTADVNDTN